MLEMYRNHVKRWLDFLIALTVAVLLFPIFALTALAVRVKLGSPILFTQVRVGRFDETFLLYKFRTMTESKDEDGNLLPDEIRLTTFGKFLRSTSLDEIPSLFNIVKGELSLVGPRPLLPQYIPRYSPLHRRRHEVRPGLTGLAQVNGRNNLPWADRFDLDVAYIESCTLWKDLKIVWKTIISVGRRSGISESGNATQSEFLGY
jgi:lipopolysaccharide/colanic/teichoic acid biosynthesis glycosyltransferase